MNLQDLKNNNEKVLGTGEAFGGLQTTKDGKSAILSFSEIIYYNNSEINDNNNIKTLLSTILFIFFCFINYMIFYLL